MKIIEHSMIIAKERYNIKQLALINKNIKRTYKLLFFFFFISSLRENNAFVKLFENIFLINMSFLHLLPYIYLQISANL